MVTTKNDFCLQFVCVCVVVMVMCRLDDSAELGAGGGGCRGRPHQHSGVVCHGVSGEWMGCHCPGGGRRERERELFLGYIQKNLEPTPNFIKCLQNFYTFLCI